MHRVLPPRFFCAVVQFLVQAPQCTSNGSATTLTPEIHIVPTLKSSGMLAPIKTIFTMLSHQVRAIPESIVKGQIIKEVATKPTPNPSNMERLTTCKSKLQCLDAIDTFAICQHGDDDIGPDTPAALSPRSDGRYAAHTATAGAAACSLWRWPNAARQGVLVSLECIRASSVECVTPLECRLLN